MKLYTDIRIITNCYACPNSYIGSEAEESDPMRCQFVKDYNSGYWTDGRIIPNNELFKKIQKWCPLKDITVNEFK